MPGNLRSGWEILTKKSPHQVGSLLWKAHATTALTLAANVLFERWVTTHGADGLNPAHPFRICFIGDGPFTKAVIQSFPGDYEVDRQTAGRVVTWQMADALSGAAKHLKEGFYRDVQF